MLTGAVALKENELQFVSNEAGDVPGENPGGLGMYFRDTRFLSRFELWVNGFKPVFLSHSANKHYIATFQSINPPLALPDGRRVKQQTISIRRSRFVSEACLYERIGFMNCNHFDVDLELTLALDADFKDIFSIRGFKTQRVAGQITVTFGGEDLAFSYAGRDGLTRSTVATFSETPEAISAREVRFAFRLSPRERRSIVVRVQPRIEGQSREPNQDFDGELERLARSYRAWDHDSTEISTDNELFDRGLLRASRYDIRTLIERTEYGLVADAGVPWYAVPFGRDAILTALQCLMYNPQLAEGTLRFLAANQGKVVDPYKEEEPGKILHELRRGELARLNEVPHTPYFGTVDATPLFLVLFVETMAWQDSDDLYQDILPSALLALEWIDKYGDADSDGYVEYKAQRAGGVVNHGWKDSFDSVQYEDGTSAIAPIALVEVQGYVYHAKIGMADLLARRGDQRLATRLQQEAEALRRRFNEDFWMEDEGTFAQALDANKRQVRSVTSNAGHCLWSGIADPDKGRLVATRLMRRDMFSGWGIRTLSSDSANYNPMSYHNGSVWPHDTAIIALGMRRSGEHEQAVQLIKGMFEAGFRFDDGRLPELFCGFERDQRFNSSPAAYVVSCSPQAWAAGCVFMLLQSMLDLQPRADAGSVEVDPILPQLFSRVALSRVKVGKHMIDVRVERTGPRVDVNVNPSLVDTRAESGA